MSEYRSTHRPRPSTRRPAVRKTTQKNNGRSALIIVSVVLCLLALLVVMELAFNAGKIHYGVTVSGYQIAGMKQGTALYFLAEETAQYEDHTISVQYGTGNNRVRGSDLGLNYDCPSAAKQAYEVGRAGSLFEQIAARFTCYTDGVALTLMGKTDKKKSDKIIAAIAEEIDSEPVDWSVEFVEGKFKLKAGKDGQHLSRAGLLAKLNGSYLTSTTEIDAPVDVLKVGVTKDTAKKTKDEITTRTKDDIVIEHNSQSRKVSADSLRKLINFKRADQVSAQDFLALPTSDVELPEGQVGLSATVSQKKVEKVLLPDLKIKVGNPPKNARFHTKGGKVKIIPSKIGNGVDSSVTAQEIAGILSDRESERVVVLSITQVEPEITTAGAEKMGIIERISTFTTTFDPSNKPRVENIKLLASSLDGTLVKPNTVFSFNETTGKRTAAAGYQEAGAIVNGEIVNQLGGGICQVNTTLFNSVLLAGLPVEQRVNHSFFIASYPLGRDATVSWGGPDFKFKNNLKKWVLVSTSYAPGSVTISLYGTDPGYDVTLGQGKWGKRTKFKTKETVDPELAEGTKVVESAGVEGGKAEMKRTVMKGDKLVSETVFHSNYEPKDEIVRIGTKAKKVKEEKKDDKKKTEGN